MRWSELTGYFDGSGVTDVSGHVYVTFVSGPNYLTGFAEIILGTSLGVSPLIGHSGASIVAYALFWLTIAMTPANVNMLVRISSACGT